MEKNRDEFWRISATELSQRIDAGELSPVELLEHCLARCRDFDPVINAHVLVDKDRARRAAIASEQRARVGKRYSRLDGLPLTVKDNIFVAGLRATWGSFFFAEFVPEEDEIPVARLRRAGAVIAAKTNTCEFAMAPVTENRLFGVTRNPWRVDLTPGGSSGGAVASVAAGVFPLAIATDAGGSIRRPASYSGVVGFKPTTGRVPRVYGFSPLASDFQVVGPIARTVDDVAMLFDVMAGPDRRDCRSYLGQFLTHETKSTKIRILAVTNASGRAIDPEVRASVEDAAAALTDLGHDVELGPPPYDIDEIDEIWSILTSVGVKVVLDQFPGQLDNVDHALVSMAERATDITAAEYLRALERVTSLRRTFAMQTECYDVLLTPTSAALPWSIDCRFPETIDGRDVSPRAAAVFATFVNAVGHPAINLPGKPSRDGLPIGIQLVGRFGEDRRVLALAREFETIRPWHDRWPPLVMSATTERVLP